MHLTSAAPLPRALRTIVASALVAVALLAATAIACGSSDPDPTATATRVPPTATPSQAAAAPTTADSAADADAVQPTPVPVRFEDLPRRDGGEITGIEAWINSEPTTIANEVSKGNVVLVDFWTYTCVNCLRTLPFLQEWHEKYADLGLVILGVHAPEFEFEKLLHNVERSVEEDGVAWPVALDNDMRTWRSFNNRYWPAKYLIGTDNEVHYTHFGEGAYRETEIEIRAALVAAGKDVADIPVGEIENVARDLTAFEVTRELYGGYERNYNVFSGGYAHNREYYDDPNATVEYMDEGVYPSQKFVLHGLWTNEAEAVVHARETDDLSDYIALRFLGRSANVVIDPPESESFRVYVELDDRPLMPEEFGDDIKHDVAGRSYFDVTEGRMYRILEVPEFGQHILKLSSNSDNFAIFAFTFGIYDGGF